MKRFLSSLACRAAIIGPVLLSSAAAAQQATFGNEQIDQLTAQIALCLTAQGANAPGGAKSYFRDGRLTEGFALVAWPDKYGETGVTSFVVSRNAVVYEKDLGPNTQSIASAMQAFDPDATWTKSVVAD